MAQYNFGIKRGTVQNTQLNESINEGKQSDVDVLMRQQFDKKRVKDLLMNQFRKFKTLHLNDQTVIDLCKRRIDYHNNISYNFFKFNNARDESEEQRNEYQNNLNRYNNLFNTTDTEYRDMMKRHINIIYRLYPKLFEMLISIKGLDESAFMNVLQTFDMMANGSLTEKEAIKEGIKFMEDKYHIPMNNDDASIEQTLKKMRDEEKN